LVPSKVLSVPTKNEIISTLHPKDMYRMKKNACPNQQKLKGHQNKKKKYAHRPSEMWCRSYSLLKNLKNT
jgi:hypothetical protein